MLKSIDRCKNLKCKLNHGMDQKSKISYLRNMMAIHKQIILISAKDYTNFTEVTNYDYIHYPPILLLLLN